MRYYWNTIKSPWNHHSHPHYRYHPLMAPHLTKIDPAPGVLFQAGNRMDILGKNIDQELLLLPAEERTPGDSPRVHGWLVAGGLGLERLGHWQLVGGVKYLLNFIDISVFLQPYLGWLDVLGCLKTTNQINKTRWLVMLCYGTGFIFHRI